MSQRHIKQLLLCGLSLIAVTLHAQQPGVDCAPIQGQGWSGCAPRNSSQPSTQGQQSQVPQTLPQRWQDHWGAIATYVPKGSLGAVNNLTSASQAEQAALEDCRSKEQLAR
jgi:hypothetical protein